MPSNVSASFSPNPVSGGAGTSTLTLSVDKKARTGTYTIGLTIQ